MPAHNQPKALDASALFESAWNEAVAEYGNPDAASLGGAFYSRTREQFLARVAAAEAKNPLQFALHAATEVPKFAKFSVLQSFALTIQAIKAAA